jgi:hypothetical protein
MGKVVINRCYGGFSLSDEATQRYADIKGIKVYPEKDKWGHVIFWLDAPEARDQNTSQVLCIRDIQRQDPILVHVVEEMGDKANGGYARLIVEDLPDGTQYRIDEYDGMETIQTRDSEEWLTA